MQHLRLFALFTAAAVTACGSSSTPAPESPASASSSSETNSPPAASADTSSGAAPSEGSSASERPSKEEFLQLMKEGMRGIACGPGKALRTCYAVPDDAACNAAWDETWTACSTKLPDLDQDSAEPGQVEDFEKCAHEQFRTKFGAVKGADATAACEKARAAERTQSPP